MSDQPIRLTPPPEGYADWLSDLKGRIHTAASSRNCPTTCWTISVGHDWRTTLPGIEEIEREPAGYGHG